MDICAAATWSWKCTFDHRLIESPTGLLRACDLISHPGSNAPLPLAVKELNRTRVMNVTTFYGSMNSAWPPELVVTRNLGENIPNAKLTLQDFCPDSDVKDYYNLWKSEKNPGSVDWNGPLMWGGQKYDYFCTVYCDMVEVRRSLLYFLSFFFPPQFFPNF